MQQQQLTNHGTVVLLHSPYSPSVGIFMFSFTDEGLVEGLSLQGCSEDQVILKIVLQEACIVASRNVLSTSMGTDRSV